MCPPGKPAGGFSDTPPAPHCPHQELGVGPKSLLLGPQGLLQLKPRHPTQARDRPVVVLGLPPDGLHPPQVRTIPPSPPSSSSAVAHKPWGGCLVSPILSAHPRDPRPCPHIPGTATLRPVRRPGQWGGPNVGPDVPLAYVYMHVRVEHAWYRGQAPCHHPPSPCHLCCTPRGSKASLNCCGQIQGAKKQKKKEKKVNL